MNTKGISNTILNVKNFFNMFISKRLQALIKLTNKKTIIKYELLLIIKILIKILLIIKILIYY